ncbi:hypothetical protein GCM10028862_10850 [Luteimonas pelagia]
MPIRSLAVFALALAFALPALAQQPAPASDARPIEQRMSPEEFRAAGLDKLSPEELANLNAWMRGTLQVETTRAAQAAEQQVKDTHRGFLSFGSSDPIVARVVGEFTGFGRGKRYTLDNGQVWEQVDSARIPGARKANPEVTIKPAVLGEAWYMRVEGYNTNAKVKRVK